MEAVASCPPKPLSRGQGHLVVGLARIFAPCLGRARAALVWRSCELPSRSKKTRRHDVSFEGGVHTCWTTLRPDRGCRISHLDPASLPGWAGPRTATHTRVDSSDPSDYDNISAASRQPCCHANGYNQQKGYKTTVRSRDPRIMDVSLSDG